MGSFGNKFRKEREKRGFSLDDVSNVTKIGSRMLQAIEDEKFDLLPGGVFNRGFIRAYAKHLGLNDEEAVTEYLECLREAQISTQTVGAGEKPLLQEDRAKAGKTARSGAAKKPYVGPKSQTIAIPPGETFSAADELPDLQLPRAEHLRPRRNFSAQSFDIPWKIPALAVVIIALAVFFWSRHSRIAHTGTPSQNAPQSSPVMVAEAQTTLNAATRSTSMSMAASPKPAAAQPTAPLTAPNPAAARQIDDSAVTVTKISQPGNHPAAAPTPPVFTLTIRAAENSWISVSADGRTVSQETLIAPAHTSVRATREIVVKAGNAAAITFVFNGKEIPAEGAEGEVKTFLFDSTGLKPTAN